jgi:predicted metalloprotease with PDZ domain
MIQYKISFENPNDHTFSILMIIPRPDPEGQVLTLPNWIPGSYMIRDFSKNITSLKAFSAGTELVITKIDKSTWKVEPGDDEIAIHYEVFALDLSVRSAHMDNTHAFFNGTSMFLNPVGVQADNFSIEVMQPTIELASSWTVKTALSKQNLNNQGFGTYLVESYDELIDCPVEISDSKDLSFAVADVQHYLHLTGDIPKNVDTNLIEKDLQPICNEHVAMFGGVLPPERYLFMTMVSQNGYGGLEHKSSTALLCSPNDLPIKHKTRQSDDYLRFLGLCSHEYFHLWNVKRLKPLVLRNSDLSGETHTGLLWFFEGVTSYYDDLALLRSGVIDLGQYLALMAKTFTRYFRSEGRFKQTLQDSSFDAWTKFYKQDSNAINAIVSYYNKGMVVAFGLDITLRRETANQFTLDDLMRHLWTKYGFSESGIEENQIEREVEILAGKSFSDFFDFALRSTSELPVSDWLTSLGIGLNLRPEKTMDDQGEYLENLPDMVKDDHASLTLGCKLKPGSNVIHYVLHDSPAEKAGLCPDDELLAVNNRKITATNLDQLLELSATEGVELCVHSFRRGVLYVARLVPDKKYSNTCDLYLIDSRLLSDDQVAMQDDWRSSSVR